MKKILTISILVIFLLSIVSVSALSYVRKPGYKFYMPKITGRAGEELGTDEEPWKSPGYDPGRHATIGNGVIKQSTVIPSDWPHVEQRGPQLLVPTSFVPPTWRHYYTVDNNGDYENSAYLPPKTSSAPSKPPLTKAQVLGKPVTGIRQCIKAPCPVGTSGVKVATSRTGVAVPTGVKVAAPKRVTEVPVPTTTLPTETLPTVSPQPATTTPILTTPTVSTATTTLPSTLTKTTPTAPPVKLYYDRRLKKYVRR